MAKNDLEIPLVQVRCFNKSHSFTGLLLYQNCSFMQALEGDNDVVDRLFERMFKDHRHREITKLFGQKATSSSFAEWSMGLFRLSDEGSEIEDSPGYSPVLRENLDPMSIDLESELTFNLVCLFKQYARADKSNVAT